MKSYASPFNNIGVISIIVEHLIRRHQNEAIPAVDAVSDGIHQANLHSAPALDVDEQQQRGSILCVVASS